MVDSVWPSSPEGLVVWQRALATAAPALWRIPAGPYAVGGCFVCFARGGQGAGARGDAAWAAACALACDRSVAQALVRGEAGAAYRPGLLALREGALLETAVRGLARRPDVLLVNAGGRDHPRRAGLAIALGAVLDIPTAGVTHRPLLADGPWPQDQRGATAPLRIDGEQVGVWLRTLPDVRPLAVHPGWRTDTETAVTVVLDACCRVRTPAPLRHARRLARRARAAAARCS
jgi:deoxyribonuclease V